MVFKRTLALDAGFYSADYARGSHDWESSGCRQNLEAFDRVQRQIAVSDLAIEGHLQTLATDTARALGLLPAARPRRKPRDNEPRFELRSPLHHVTGVDLSQVEGIGPYTALRLLSEIGTDRARWPSDRHFASWSLSPRRTRFRAAGS